VLRDSVSKYIGRFHRRSACVYTPSAPARDDLRAMGVRRVEVWGAASTSHRSAPIDGASRSARRWVSINPVVFLHVGRLAAEKGVDVIIRAFALAREMMPARAARLVVAGAGPAEASLREVAGPDVSFLGVLDRAKSLPRLYASADAFLFSSLTETLGLVVLEAMASGLPVVATPAGGVADHLRDGENGIAIGPRDVEGMAKAIVMLTLNADRRRQLGAAALATAHELDWERELDRLDESYREILGQSPVTPHATLRSLESV
jgi:glycosyltransferase involved in cell wall biosynthesis